MDDCRVFAYIDGIPTKGAWVDIDELTDTDDVIKALAEGGVFDDRLDPEIEDQDVARENAAEAYRGDLLVADAEGLARHFVGSHGSFEWSDFKEWAEFLDSHKHVDEEALVAYFEWIGTDADIPYFEEAYLGTHRSSEDWAETFMNDVYDIPDFLVNYIDYSKFVRDCECDGYHFADVPGGVAVFRSH